MTRARSVGKEGWRRDADLWESAPANTVNVNPSNTYVKLREILLNEGVWDLQGGSTFTVTTGPCTMRGLSLSESDNAAGAINGISQDATTASVGVAGVMVTPLRRVTVTGPDKLFYLVGRAAFSGGSVQATNSWIAARRIS